MSVALAPRVRHFRDGDEPFVARLAKRSFWEFDEDAGASTLRMAASNTTLVAIEGRMPVGFVIVDMDQGRGPAGVIAIAVEPRRRGSGIGYGLLCSAERFARVGGSKELVIHTADFNLAALELFIRSGYRMVRRLPRFYRNRFDACELRKRL